MSWSSNHDDLRTIGSYAAALSRWESVTPIRGSNLRPLGNRRKQHQEIIKRADNSIACKLYRTDVVTFHPDESVEVRTYNSRSTATFADALLPSGLRAFMHLGRMAVRMACDTGTEAFFESAQTLIFRKTSHSNWELTTVPAEQEHVVLDKVKTREIRKALKPYADYAGALLRLGVKPEARKGVDHQEMNHHLKHCLDAPWPMEVMVKMFHSVGHVSNALDRTYMIHDAFIRNRLPYGVLEQKCKWK